MGIEAVTPENWKQHGSLVLTLSWQEADRNAPVAIGSGMSSGGKATVTRTADVPLFPLPIFRIRLANTTNSPLSFANVQAQLSDGTHTYPLMARVDVMGRVTSDIMSQHQEMAANNEEMDSVRSAITQAALVDPKLTVAPNQEWDGYIVFKTDAHNDDEVNALLLGGSTFTVAIGNLTAGGKTVGTFTFALPQKPNNAPTTCPGDVKKPSLEKCKLDSATPAPAPAAATPAKS